jgi:hypothetical protein
MSMPVKKRQRLENNVKTNHAYMIANDFFGSQVIFLPRICKKNYYYKRISPRLALGSQELYSTSYIASPSLL